MDIIEILERNIESGNLHRPFSPIINDFVMCQSCSIVDRDQDRMKVGYQCPRCGIPSRGGASCFPMGIDSLIDLMARVYLLKQFPVLDSDTYAERHKNDHLLIVVILFCAFVEVLLQNFLEGFMHKLGLTYEVQQEHLRDNLFMTKRIKKLFPELTKAEWVEVVTMLSKRANRDYMKTNEFCMHAADARNKFLHNGNMYAIPQDMPEQCIRHIWPLLHLFVDLHNEYVARSINEEA